MKKAELLLLPILGTLIVLVANYRDIFGLSQPGVGLPQILLTTLGLTLLIIGLKFRTQPFQLIKTTPLAARFLLATGVIYTFSFIVNIFFLAFSPKQPTRNSSFGTRNLHIPDEKTGYRLNPGWKGWYDDGIARGRYEINSLGYRDDELHIDPTIKQIFLLGDSFTFGALLDQEQTIDKHLEQYSSGRINAHNLGVGGFGLPSITETLRRAPEMRVNHVFYLFFNNDLRNDNLLDDQGLTVCDGYIVPRYDTNGNPFSQEALQQQVDTREARFLSQLMPSRLVSAKEATKKLILLESLRDRTNHGKLRIGQPFFEQNLLSGGTRIGAFSPANVEKAVQHVIDLKRLTELRNASFHVLLLPTRYEARINRYSNLVYEFIESAQQRGVFFIDAIESFDPTDYWPHNGHFSPKGAAKAAKQILLNFNDV